MHNKESSLLQKTYIQKSRLFLFPLIGIRHDRAFRPTNTYISSKNLRTSEYPNGIKPSDNILIIAYTKDYARGSSEQQWSIFEAEQIVGNRKFMGIHETDDEFVYTMNMSSFSADIKCFTHGRYSLFSEKAKTLILNFRRSSLKPTEHRKLYCYLYPYDEQCLKSFAEELGISTQQLMEVKELCTSPNMAMESFKCENLKESLSKDEAKD